MLIVDLKNCKPFAAGDGTALKEMFHPGKQGVSFRYSLAHATLKPGASSVKHRLKTSEVYYLLKGRGRLHIGAESAIVYAGQAVYIPPGSVQYIENTGKTRLEFLCVVDPAWKKQDEDVL